MKYGSLYRYWPREVAIPSILLHKRNELSFCIPANSPGLLGRLPVFNQISRSLGFTLNLPGNKCFDQMLIIWVEIEVKVWF